MLEDQYRKFILVEWKNEEIFKAKEIAINDTEKFWISVLQHSFFKDLAQYAFACLVTLVSNAVAERIFSLLTAIKTKLEAIIGIRTDMLRKDRCCKDLFESKNMLVRFKSDIVYKQTNSSSVDDAMQLLH